MLQTAIEVWLGRHTGDQKKGRTEAESSVKLELDYERRIRFQTNVPLAQRSFHCDLVLEWILDNSFTDRLVLTTGRRAVAYWPQ